MPFVPSHVGAMTTTCFERWYNQIWFCLFKVACIFDFYLICVEGMTALFNSGTLWSPESTIKSYLLYVRYTRQMILRFIVLKNSF